MLTLYLINEGEKSVLSGAMPYGLPYDMKDNVPFFRKNAFSIYDKLMGINLYMIIKSKLPELRTFFNNENIDEYNELVSNLERYKFSLMDLDSKVFIPLHGFKTDETYYAYT